MNLMRPLNVRVSSNVLWNIVIFGKDKKLISLEIYVPNVSLVEFAD